MGIGEALPKEKHYEHKQLLYLMGYYTLVLDTIDLSPDWKDLYEERLAEMQTKIEGYENA